jgi:hypothetical protein
MTRHLTRYKLSAECDRDGSGDCVGEFRKGRWCECYCHVAYGLPITAEGRRTWHRDQEAAAAAAG